MMKTSTHVLCMTAALVLCVQTGWANDRPTAVTPWDNDQAQLDMDIRALIDQFFDEGEGPLLGGSGTGMQSGADHIVNQQCSDGGANDGGWTWPHGLSCTTVYHNITAPIAFGPLHTYSFSGDPAHLASAVAGGDFDLTSEYTDPCDPNQARFGAFTSYFLWKLSAATGDSTYSDFAEVEFFDALNTSTYGCNSDWSTADWIAIVVAARQGTWINLLPWEFHNIIPTATAIGNAGQDDLFTDALLAGLNTMDNTDPFNVYSDLIGLSGGVRGLAFGGTMSFTAINSPLHSGISGIDNLCDLAAQLISYQNGDGSWYWHSDLPAPEEDDKDTQTSAYAVLALLAAQDAGCGPYDTEIALGRAWIRTMQENDGGFLSYPGGTNNTEVEGEALQALIPETMLTLNPNPSCYDLGGPVPVTIDLTDATDLIVGGQFFLSYDNTVLDFVSIEPGDAPFVLEISETVDETAGTIDYAVGVDFGGMGTMADTTMAVITFTAIDEICDTAGLVSFRMHSPPNRLTDEFGASILVTPGDLEAITVDSTAPVITCPGDISLNADAGGCDATVDIGTAIATDTCDPTPVIVGVRDDALPLGDPYPFGTTTTITWTATDECGNESTCMQTVTVSDVNELVLALDLSPTVDTSVTRCITFELWKCPDVVPTEIVSMELTFTNGMFSGTVELPCGDYDCITARDTLHTLRRTATLSIAGSEPAQYVADFTSTSANDLVGGNLNDDLFIDILDFGIFVGQFGADYGTGDTTCTTPFPHADISGNGTVGVEDFTFISINFLAASEANCCGAMGAQGRVPNLLAPRLAAGPIIRISVRQLKRMGLGDLVVGDLNHDGWLDTQDMVEFFNGGRP